MRILESNYIAPAPTDEEGQKKPNSEPYFLKGLSLTKSFPPLMLSARNTLPVVAIATIWECSLNGLKEMGSWISPVASFLE